MKGTPIVQLQARFINMFEGLEFYYKPKKKGGGVLHENNAQSRILKGIKIKITSKKYLIGKYEAINLKHSTRQRVVTFRFF